MEEIWGFGCYCVLNGVVFFYFYLKFNLSVEIVILIFFWD